MLAAAVGVTGTDPSAGSNMGLHETQDLVGVDAFVVDVAVGGAEPNFVGGEAGIVDGPSAAMTDRVGTEQKFVSGDDSSAAAVGFDGEPATGAGALTEELVSEYSAGEELASAPHRALIVEDSSDGGANSMEEPSADACSCDGEDLETGVGASTGHELYFSRLPSLDEGIADKCDLVEDTCQDGFKDITDELLRHQIIEECEDRVARAGAACANAQHKLSDGYKDLQSTVAADRKRYEENAASNRARCNEEKETLTNDEREHCRIEKTSKLAEGNTCLTKSLPVLERQVLQKTKFNKKQRDIMAEDRKAFDEQLNSKQAYVDGTVDSCAASIRDLTTQFQASNATFNTRIKYLSNDYESAAGNASHFERQAMDCNIAFEELMSQADICGADKEQLKTEHAQEIQKMEEEHKNQIADMKTRHAKELVEAERKGAEEVKEEFKKTALGLQLSESSSQSVN
ncbi:expressed unknown protein [Seminavis robusta]|uniref:Uncharacterized protein n=1 Tax=Seminavis robusta TaxID=568900 RepID=A0A9N8E3U6_9STRA|nr:expressed unknown protein [Seminavis robusta]|eukprot:Sro632_g178640.1 n/a (458) ;mRNA; r:10708-12731